MTSKWAGSPAVSMPVTTVIDDAPPGALNVVPDDELASSILTTTFARPVEFTTRTTTWSPLLTRGSLQAASELTSRAVGTYQRSSLIGELGERLFGIAVRFGAGPTEDSTLCAGANHPRGARFV